MKKTILKFGFLLLLSTPLFSSNFSALTYGQSIEDKSFNDSTGKQYDFSNIQSYGFRQGTHYLPTEESEHTFGVYINANLQKSDAKYYVIDGENQELAYETLLVNVGTTYALNNNFVLFGGVGFHAGSFSREEIESIEKISQVNLNGGLMVYLFETQFGLTVEYNSAPKTVTAGVVYRW